MRHALGHRKFCRSTSHRLAMLNNLAISLINHEQIITTLPKAKELRPYLERLVTMARNKNTLHSRRILLSRLKNGNAVDKLFAVFAGRYKDRNGGYLRIVKNGFRRGDCAPIAVIEFVDRDISAKGRSY